MPRDLPLPDGTIIRNVPDTVTDEQFQAMAASKGRGQTPVSANDYGTNPPDMEAKILGPAGMGAKRGFMRGTEGAIRLGLRAATEMGLVGPEVLGKFEEAAGANEEEYKQKQARNFPNASGFATGGGEVLGTAGFLAPLSKIKVGNTEKVLPRIVTNAAQSGLGGAIMAGPEDSTINQALANATIGAAVPELINVALKTLGYTSSWVASKMGKRTSEAVSSAKDFTYGEPNAAAREQLKAAGIDWDNLTRETKDNVTKWVIENGGKTELTLSEATRLGILKNTTGGATPSRAMITQNFNDSSKEAALYKQSGGEPLRNTYENVQRGFGDRMEMEGMKLGGTTEDTSVTGLKSIDALQAGYDETEAAKRAAYVAADSDPSAKNRVSFAGVRKLMEDEKSSHLTATEARNLRDGVLLELEKMKGPNGGTRQISAKEAEAFKQWLNAKWLPNQPERGKMIQQLKNAVDDAVLGSGNGDVYEIARKAHQLQRETYTDKELIRDLLQQRNSVDRKVAVEDVWDRVVLKSDVAQFADFKNTLTRGSRVTMGEGESATVAKGNEVWKDYQTSTMKWLKDQATSKSSGPNGSPLYDPNGLENAIRKIGKEKMLLLFGDDGVKQINETIQAMKMTRPIKGVATTAAGNRLFQYFRDNFSRGAAAAVGAHVGGPVGAAAFAAGAGGAANAFKQARVGETARMMAENPIKSITRSRKPIMDFTDAVPSGYQVNQLQNYLNQASRDAGGNQ